jgi:CBS domain containing-hemolysin-like protein
MFQSRPTAVSLAPRLWLPLAAILVSTSAQASLLSGDALDTMADVVAWIVLIVAPVTVIALFWMVHILPEKIAERRRHPQAKAIQVLCLLSLVFGGLLWPLAWLWAYSKPVLYKMAYGTDVAEEAAGHGGDAGSSGGGQPQALQDEITQLRSRLAALEAEAEREARS